MHIRCPHCHNRIEVVDESPLDEVCCPSCGSAFNLVTDFGTATQPLEKRTLGHFELLEQLGFGHFGAVWKARDTQLDRIVAVKIPRKDQLTAEEVLQFLREARAAAQLKHPGIVPVHEVGRDGDTIYIVSEFVEGATLREWLSADKPTPHEAAELCAKIADALHDAHVSGVIHRDLKPGNIMLDTAGEPHIMDFGLAKRESGEITMTVEGRILGTPAYMPPEQARGEGHHADRRSDLYSLGVILFELLTGELPFRGETRMLVVQILNDAPPSPRKLNSRAPRDLETICLKCLEKDPQRRYQTAGELADDLRRYLDGRPILARPLGSLQRGWRWVRRHPARAGLLAAISIALLAFVAVGVGFGYQRRLEMANRNLADEKLRLARANTEVEKANEQLSTTNYHLAMANRSLADEKLRLARANTEVEKANEQLSTTNYHLGNAKRDLDQAHELLGRSAYADRINLAQRELDRGATLRARQYLSECDAKYRGWEWDHLSQASQFEIAKLVGHTYVVNHVAFSPDGTRLASAGGAPKGFGLDGHQNTVCLWDAQTGKRFATLEGHTRGINQVRFSADGKRLASASDDETVRLWDAATGEHVATLEGGTGTGPGAFPQFSADGKRLASVGFANKLLVSDASTGKLLAKLEGHTNGVLYLACSPDGARLASAGGDGTVRLCDIATGKPLITAEGQGVAVLSGDGTRLASLSARNAVLLWDAVSGKPLATLTGHTDLVTHLALSPNGARLASTGYDGTLRLWDVATGKLLATLEAHTHANQMAFSPDGARLAYEGVDKMVRLWDAASGKAIATFAGSQAAFSADGMRLASASANHSIRVWDAASGKLVDTLEGHTRGVNHLAFSPDGARLASASEDLTARLWDLAGGQPLIEFEGRRAAVSSDGTRLAAIGPDSAATVLLWQLATGKLLATLEGHSSWVTQIAFSADGKRLATASDDKTARLYEVPTGRLLARLEGHTGSVLFVAFSADGSRLASAAADATVRLWDAATGKLLATLPYATLRGSPDRVQNVAFSPDGKRLVTGSDDRTVRVWDAQTGEFVVASQAHQSIASMVVAFVAFSPDGARLASVAEYGTGIRLWDAASGNPLPTAETLEPLTGLETPTRGINRLTFGPDGKRLVGSADRTAGLWDVATGKLLAKLEGHTGAVGPIAFSPDGKRLASASDGRYLLWAGLWGLGGTGLNAGPVPDPDTTVRLWDATSGKLLVKLEGHTSYVQRLAFSPDGQRLASASDDKTVRVWDALTGKLLTTLEEHDSTEGYSSVPYLGFTPDGKRIVAAGRGDSVRIWLSQETAEEKQGRQQAWLHRQAQLAVQRQHRPRARGH